VGEVAYRLDLSASSKIHDVVHVSQLKQRLPTASPVSDDVALLNLDSFALLQPQEILARRYIQRGNTLKACVLVRWLGLPATIVTWVDEAVLQQRYPSSLAWDQTSTQEG
jgi:hypothetical protein